VPPADRGGRLFLWPFARGAKIITKRSLQMFGSSS
jgi:hypothetical protein